MFIFKQYDQSSYSKFLTGSKYIIHCTKIYKLILAILIATSQLYKMMQMIMTHINKLYKTM